MRKNYTQNQFAEFAKQMVMYIAAEKYDKPVCLLENLEKEKEKLPSTGCCVICARGRNIPLTESKNVTFESKDIAKLRDVEETYCNIVPIVAYVCVDEMEKVKKVRIFFAKLDDVEKMSEDSVIGFLKESKGGITLRYTEGKIVQWLTEIKKSTNEMQYVELQWNNTVSQ